MLVSSQLVFEGYVTGTTNVYSKAENNDALAIPNSLTIGGYTAQVTGTSPTITVQVEQSFDNVRWMSRNIVAEVNAKALGTGTAETNFGAFDDIASNRPSLAFARVRIALGGTGTVGAFVRVWAFGRDNSMSIGP